MQNNHQLAPHLIAVAVQQRTGFRHPPGVLSVRACQARAGTGSIEGEVLVEAVVRVSLGCVQRATRVQEIVTPTRRWRVRMYDELAQPVSAGITRTYFRISDTTTSEPGGQLSRIAGNN